MITLGQYQEIYTEKIDSVFFRQIHFVSVVNNLDPIDVQDWSMSKIQKEFLKCRKDISIGDNYKEVIKIDDKELHLIDFKHLKLGQYFDLESYITKGYISNLHLMASILFLQKEGGGMNEEKPESFAEVNRDYRSKLISKLPAEHILGAVNKYLPFRDNFFKSYTIFENPLEGIDPNELDEEEAEIYEEEKKEAEKNRRTQNLRMLNELSNNDVTKFEEILNMNLFLAFNQFEFIRSQK